MKLLFALPFLALSAAGMAAPSAPPKPIALVAPAEIAADPANRLTLELSNGGTVVVQLRPDIAPSHVFRIQQLVTSGFYNGIIFHRVIPGFMAQSGDPTGTGQGGSPLPDLKAEFNDLPHLRGVISAARAEPIDSANSQFFIMLAPNFKLDHKYSAFGRVIEGMAAVDLIEQGEPPANPTKIVRASLGGPMPAVPLGYVAPPAAPASPAATDAAASPADLGPPPPPDPAPATEQPQAEAATPK